MGPLNRIRTFLAQRSLDRDFDRELESHLAMLSEDYARRGLPPDEALRAARVRFGGVAQLREAHRDTRGLPWLDAFFQDVRYALRGVRHNAGFTALAVLTLALGMGVNTAVFTVIDGTLLRPIQAADPGSLVQLTRVWRDPQFSFSDYAYYRDGNRSFSGLAAMGYHTFQLSGTPSPVAAGDGGIAGAVGFQFPRVLPGGAEPVPAVTVSTNYFQVLGVQAAMGRTFLPEDGNPASPPVALASYNFWERRFARDPGMLGRVLTLNGVSVTIIGILTRDFVGTATSVPDVWMPLAVQARLAPQEDVLHNRDFACCRLYGRLRPGAAQGQAQAELDALAAGLEHTRPDRQRDRFLVGEATRGGQPGQSDVVAPVLLLAAVGLVLLIACANVASLLLARSAARQREITIRLAIGAGRARLVRQLLTENLVIAMLAAGTGVLFSWWLLHALIAQIQAALPAVVGGIGLSVTPDLRVMGYTLLLAVGATLVFGLAPALETSRPNLSAGLKGDGPAFAGRFRGSRLRDSMVGTQVAVCLVLLIGAGVFARASERALRIDLGFNYRNILSLEVVFPAGTPAARIAATRVALAQRLEALPEIQSVAVASRLPLVHGGMRSFAVSTDGKTGMPESNYLLATPNYFETFQIPLARGRGFTSQEARTGANFDGAPVIVSEAAARRFWPGEDAIGKRLAFGGTDGRGESDAHSAASYVIGVARDIRSWRLETVDTSLIYLPVTRAFGGTASGTSGRPEGVIALRFRGNERGAVAEVERELQLHFSDLEATVGNPRTAFTDQRAFIASRAGAIGAAIIGIAGLLMAVAGIYGTVGFAVTQRVPEMGIRMALGARRSDVLGLILWQTMRPVMVGLGIGLAGGAAISRLLHSILFGLSALDPIAFLGASCFLAAAALLAGYLPARRVTRIDSMIALRYE